MVMKKGLNEINLGFSGGIIFGAIVLLTTLVNVLFGQYIQTTNLFLDFYGILGYDVTIFGSILGAIYGFIDGFILFWLIAIIYNRLNK